MNVLIKILNILAPSKGVSAQFLDHVEEGSSVITVRLKGAIDMTTIPNIEKTIKKRGVRRGTMRKSILLDFKKVTNIDSSTIAALLDFLSYIKSRKHKLALVNVSSQMKRRIDVDKLNDVFSIFRSEKEGLSFLEKKVRAKH